MRALNRRLVRTTTGMAGALAALLALIFPLAFFVQQYQANTAAMTEEVRYSATNTSRMISANPEFWQFEAPRLQELVKDQTETDLPESRRIVDATGRVIAEGFEIADTQESSNSPKFSDVWAISRSANLMDSGNIVGRFEVVRSLRPLLLETAVAALLGLLLGALVLVVLRVFPLRALKQALQTLANEKERAEVTLSAIGDAVITVNAQGTVGSFNPAAEKLFGHAADQVVGHDIQMLMPESHRHALAGYLARYPHTGQAYLIGIEREVTAQRSDGSIFPMELRISEFYLEGRRQFIGSMRDISERKLARDEILNLNT